MDCCAHIGYFAMHLARPSVHRLGHGFEPFDANAECLERSIRENHFEARVRLERSAVGAAPGSLPLVYAPNTINSGGAFLQGRGEIPGGHTTRTVPVVALDRWALPRPVSFIKADIEGAEPRPSAAPMRCSGPTVR